VDGVDGHGDGLHSEGQEGVVALTQSCLGDAHVLRLVVLAVDTLLEEGGLLVHLVSQTCLAFEDVGYVADDYGLLGRSVVVYLSVELGVVDLVREVGLLGVSRGLLVQQLRKSGA